MSGKDGAGQPRAHRSIGEVLNLLKEDFPEVTISKIRFLEGQGLLEPERTPSGYRKFYEHDLERLRWILIQQRDHFLPLKVIKARLDGGAVAGVVDSDQIALPLGDLAPLIDPPPAAPPEPAETDVQVDPSGEPAALVEKASALEPAPAERGSASGERDPAAWLHELAVGRGRATTLAESSRPQSSPPSVPDPDSADAAESAAHAPANPHDAVGRTSDRWSVAPRAAEPVPDGRTAEDDLVPERPGPEPHHDPAPSVEHHATGVAATGASGQDRAPADRFSDGVTPFEDAAATSGLPVETGTSSAAQPPLGNATNRPTSPENRVFDPGGPGVRDGSSPAGGTGRGGDRLITLASEVAQSMDDPGDGSASRGADAASVDAGPRASDRPRDPSPPGVTLESHESPAPGRVERDATAAGAAMAATPDVLAGSSATTPPVSPDLAASEVQIAAAETVDQVVAGPAVSGSPGLTVEDAAVEPRSMTRVELVEASGVTHSQLADLERFELVEPRTEGPSELFDEDCLQIAVTARAFFARGLEARHLRMYRVAADREAGFLEQLAAPLLRRRNDAGRAEAVEILDELGEAGIELHAAMLRRALRSYLGET